MRITCLVHDTILEKQKVILFNSPLLEMTDESFDHIQKTLNDGELLLEMYPTGVECRTIGELPGIDHEWILEVVSNYYSYPMKGWITRDPNTEPQKGWKVKCRFICYYLMRKYTNLTLKRIGDIFDGRDHSSVMHGIQTVNDSISVDEDYALEVANIEAQIIEQIEQK